MRAVDERCDRCHGPMLATMPKPKKRTRDDGYELVCMLCGHNNAPPRMAEPVDRRREANRERAIGQRAS